MAAALAILLALTAGFTHSLTSRCPRPQKGKVMPEEETLQKARQDRAAGKSPSTQAGEFVREEMHHIREGKHGARNSKQAIAIGLSEARRAERAYALGHGAQPLRKLSRHRRELQ